jgi:hypothetical protein
MFSSSGGESWLNNVLLVLQTASIPPSSIDCFHPNQGHTIGPVSINQYFTSVLIGLYYRSADKTGWIEIRPRSVRGVGHIPQTSVGATLGSIFVDHRFPLQRRQFSAREIFVTVVFAVSNWNAAKAKSKKIIEEKAADDQMANGDAHPRIEEQRRRKWILRREMGGRHQSGRLKRTPSRRKIWGRNPVRTAELQRSTQLLRVSGARGARLENRRFDQRLRSAFYRGRSFASCQRRHACIRLPAVSVVAASALGTLANQVAAEIGHAVSSEFHPDWDSDIIIVISGLEFHSVSKLLREAECNLPRLCAFSTGYSFSVKPAFRGIRLPEVVCLAPQFECMRTGVRTHVRPLHPQSMRSGPTARVEIPGGEDSDGVCSPINLDFTPAHNVDWRRNQNPDKGHSQKGKRPEEKSRATKWKVTNRSILSGDSAKDNMLIDYFISTAQHVLMFHCLHPEASMNYMEIPRTTDTDQIGFNCAMNISFHI